MVWGMTKGQCSLWFKKRVDRVLWVGCLSSWKTDVTLKWLLEEQARVNPFDRITIASAWNRDLRKNRMEPNTITSEYFHGWRLKTNFSTASLEWLLWGRVGAFNLLVTKVNTAFLTVGMLWAGTIVRTTSCASFKVVCDTDAGLITLTRLRNIVFSRTAEWLMFIFVRKKNSSSLEIKGTM